DARRGRRGAVAQVGGLLALQQGEHGGGVHGVSSSSEENAVRRLPRLASLTSGKAPLRRRLGDGGLAEHALEDHVDVLEVIAEVEQLAEFGVGEGDLGVGLQEVEEV